jgi:hypothetical protein
VVREIFATKKPGEENEFFSRVEVNMRKNGSLAALLWMTVLALFRAFFGGLFASHFFLRRRFLGRRFFG